MKSLKALAILFILFASISNVHADKIRIILKQPPPNLMGVANLWDLTLDNTTGQDMKIYLVGTASEDKDGLIIEGKSKVFTIKPGRTSYKYNDFSNAEVKYNNGKYKEIILRTGNAPEGNYLICVTAYEESGEVAGLENCITQTVQQQGSIMLTSPSDREEIDPEQPLLFTWVPLPKGGPYSLRIVELKGDQSPDVAIKNTHDVITISSTSSSYMMRGGEHYPWPLPPKKKYAWQVSAGGVESEVYTFSVKNSENTITLISPANNEVLNGEKEVTFRWSPVTPIKPVKYRLKVWQLMEGQNGTQAMKSNQPIISKDVDNTTEVTVTNIITGPCKPPYLCDFIWAVESISIDGMSTTQSGPFTFTGHASRLTLELPKNGEKLDGKEVTFKWKDTEADPNKPVKYRLRVWQLMEGQNGTTAMKDNQPLVTKEVEDISEITITNLITGPCKPPYLCDFVWDVAVMNSGGFNNPQVENNGFSIVYNDKPSGEPNILFPSDKPYVLDAKINSKIHGREIGESLTLHNYDKVLKSDDEAYIFKPSWAGATSDDQNIYGRLHTNVIDAKYIILESPDGELFAMPVLVLYDPDPVIGYVSACDGCPTDHDKKQGCSSSGSFCFCLIDIIKDTLSSARSIHVLQGLTGTEIASVFYPSQWGSGNVGVAFECLIPRVKEKVPMSQTSKR